MDPGNQQSPEQQSAERQLADRSPANSRPSNASGTTQPQTQPGLEPLAEGTAPKKRKHHGHRRRRHRRQSFAPPPDTPRPDSDTGRAGVSPGRGDGSQSTSTTAIQHRASVYRLGQLGRNNPSETSLDSDALLDHRHQPMMRPRRESRLAQSYRPEPQQLSARPPVRAQTPTAASQVMDEEESEEEDDRTPLIKPSSIHNSSFVRYGTSAGTEEHSVAPSPEGRKSVASSFRSTVPYSIGTARSLRRGYDVNNPPSVPGSPHTGPETGFDDPMIGGHDFDHTSPEHTSAVSVPCHVIDVDGEGHGSMSNSSATSQKFVSPELQRRRTVTLPVEEDVCFPGALSDLGEEDYPPRPPLEDTFGGGRRRKS
ncbi:MIT family metal ion transporter [Histoplasma capsulatum G186AR]|uniref:MIT family metal ion transporter n=1 Tax=Ajellomyces capsulatus TaxID=5037 RepID=A0A8H7Z7D0_AJECA|nr:MIT family metal ion transporter [Histoplasma capsulatum]QSS69714.1 MIT family metal ion transporter [Histoplasma capsulatum G186AR]